MFLKITLKSNFFYVYLNASTILQLLLQLASPKQPWSAQKTAPVSVEVLRHCRHTQITPRYTPASQRATTFNFWASVCLLGQENSIPCSSWLQRTVFVLPKAQFDQQDRELGPCYQNKPMGREHKIQAKCLQVTVLLHVTQNSCLRSKPQTEKALYL